MTLTLDLSPELEARLNELAAQRGQDSATFATAALADTLQSIVDAAGGGGTKGQTEPPMTWEEFEAALDELADIGRPVPVLSPETTTRAGICGDHD